MRTSERHVTQMNQIKSWQLSASSLCVCDLIYSQVSTCFDNFIALFSCICASIVGLFQRQPQHPSKASAESAVVCNMAVTVNSQLVNSFRERKTSANVSTGGRDERVIQDSDGFPEILRVQHDDSYNLKQHDNRFMPW